MVAARARLCRFPVWRLAGGVYIADVRWVLGGPSLRAGLDVASGDICAKASPETKLISSSRDLRMCTLLAAGPNLRPVTRILFQLFPR